jgi:hypothetical protein
MAGSREDAQLLVQLAQWGATMGLDEAVSAILDDGFDPASATTQDMPVRRVLNFGETIGTLVKNDLLDRELVLDWLWVAGLWQRVGPAVQTAREKYGEPRLGENFSESAATAPHRSRRHCRLTSVDRLAGRFPVAAASFSFCRPSTRVG